MARPVSWREQELPVCVIPVQCAQGPAWTGQTPPSLGSPLHVLANVLARAMTPTFFSSHYTLVTAMPASHRQPAPPSCPVVASCGFAHVKRLALLLDKTQRSPTLVSHPPSAIGGLEPPCGP
jgi:hypothetical protein